MKLLIRNLERSISEDALRSMFEKFGVVQSCSLVLDAETGDSKGFGFVTMARPGDAKAAMKSLNNQNIAGIKVRVKRAEDKKEQPPKNTQDQAETVSSVYRGSGRK